MKSGIFGWIISACKISVAHTDIFITVVKSLKYRLFDRQSFQLDVIIIVVSSDVISRRKTLKGRNESKIKSENRE